VGGKRKEERKGKEKEIERWGEMDGTDSSVASS
jgi:hypothetical protein